MPIAKTVLVLIIASLAAGPVLAQTAAKPVTTKERVLARAAKQFDALDLDKDGFVDKAEWDKATDVMVAKLRARMDAQFSEADVGKRAKLSREDFIASRMRWFDSVDTDHNGAIDQAEMNVYMRAQRKAR